LKIAVIALGKIGLPLAVQFASKGHDVIGVDVSQRTVDLVNQSIEPFPGEAQLQERLSELVPAGKLRATTSYSEAVPGADAVVLVVPLFVDDRNAHWPTRRDADKSAYVHAHARKRAKRRIGKLINSRRSSRYAER